MLTPQANDRRTGAQPGRGRGKHWSVSADVLAELHRRAAEMRRNPTEPKERLWRVLSGSKLNGLEVRRQAVLPPFIADFLCPSTKLVVEVNGDALYDQKNRLRDDLLAAWGYRVVRVTNHEVMSNLEGVSHAIGSVLASPLPFRGGAGGGGSPPAIGREKSPHPNPSPEEEGLA